METIVVNLHSASGLVSTKKGARANPYVYIESNDVELARSGIVYHTCNPTWNETLNLNVSPNTSLVFSVYCYRMVHHHERLGKITVKVSDLQYDNPSTDTWQLQDGKGTLNMTLVRNKKVMGTKELSKRLSEHVTETNPTQVEFMNFAKKEIIKQTAIIAYEKHDFPTALRLFNQYLEIEEESLVLPCIKTALGHINMELGNYEEAKKVLIGVDDATAYFNLGVVYIKTEEYENSKKSFLKCIEVDPNYEDAHENMFRIYYQDKNVDGMVYHLKQVYRINPKNVSMAKNLGEVLGNMKKNYKEACDHMLDVDRHNPNDFNIQSKLAFFLVKKGDYQTAKIYYEKALKLKPDDFMANLQMHILLRDYIKDKQALKEFTSRSTMNFEGCQYTF